jgi:nitrite reductase/ring-hydroxylating ferredoxin subunit
VSETRRQFIERAEAIGLALIPGLLPVLAGCAKYSMTYGVTQGDRLVVSRADFGAGDFALVDAPGQTYPIYLYRHDDEHFTAVLTRCMHQSCPVEPVGAQLVCPCHGSTYDNAGAIVKGPTQLPLIRYPVEVDRQNIYISLASGTGAGS